MHGTMTGTSHRGLEHLPPAAGRLGTAFARPKIIAIACIVALTGAGWFYLGLQAAGTIDVLCRALPDGGQTGPAKAAIVAAMWCAMTLAMMLPTAAPMILTYAEIADTAARKHEAVVSPFMIAAGYAVVWLGFALLATGAQLVLMRVALLDAGMASASGLFSGAIMIGAGAYQFSALKHACLTQCQHPFPFFFANWKTTPRGVFGLGVQQGLYCLGCCWAMMLVMFAVGVMNVVWMAALGIAMAIEKIGATKRFTYGVGAALIVIGAGFVLTALVAHWPGHAI
jgi:predicted metal-binding membrane protein